MKQKIFNNRGGYTKEEIGCHNCGNETVLYDYKKFRYVKTVGSGKDKQCIAVFFESVQLCFSCRNAAIRSEK